MKIVSIKRIVLVALAVVACHAYGETISVTAYGRGSTRGEAIESAKSQAVKDALGSPFSVQEPAVKVPLASPSGKIGRTRVIGVTKLGQGSYEAEVEVDVDVLAPVPLELRKRVALVSDLNQPGIGISPDLLEAITARLSSSNQITVIERQDPATVAAIERVRTAKRQGALDPLKAGKAPRVDLLCVISTEHLKHSTGASAVERHEVKARISFIDVVTAETRTIRTVKSVRSGTPVAASDAVTSYASTLIATAIADYVTPLVETENSTKVITVPTGSVKLGVGQPVFIFKVIRTASNQTVREVSVTTGEVIGVGPSYAKVVAEDYLVKSDRYVVKPIVNARPRGVVSDSDW
jgi:hypothetical protein